MTVVILVSKEKGFLLLLVLWRTRCRGWKKLPHLARSILAYEVSIAVCGLTGDFSHTGPGFIFKLVLTPGLEILASPHSVCTD
jgi:hypothetical protein